MNSIRASHSVLVLVDYQQRLIPALHGGERAVAEALRLADVAIALGIPVIGTEQNPSGLGANLEAVRQRCSQTVAKTHFDACADGLLDAIRSARGASDATTDEPLDVVLAGCEAHVCLMQTALGLLRAGHRLWVMAEACASRQAGNQVMAMQRLQQAGGTLVGFEMVVFEWLRECRHERFKRVLAMLKAPLGVGVTPDWHPDSPSTAARTTQPILAISENHSMTRTPSSQPPLTQSEWRAFESELHNDGFVEVQTREVAAGTHNTRHAHDFEVKALMLAGELTLGCDGHTATYHAGEVFTMPAGKPHTEQFGDSVACYLVGRKYPA